MIPSQILQVVSLGSSYAAGPGIPPQVEPYAAIRSGNNYGSLLAQELGANHIDLTVSGATLLNILSEPQTTVLDNQTFPPQISMLPEDADVVTITAGGNDFGYISGMLIDAWKDSKPGNLTATLGDNASQSISALESQPAPQEPNLSPEKLSQRLGNALDSIHERAPKARVFLVEYIAVLGPVTQPGVDVPFNQSKIDIYSQMADVLHNAYKLAAKTRVGWCERVPMHSLGSAHVLGSKKPWVQAFKVSDSVFVQAGAFHPNLDGMKAVASILVSRVQGSTLKEE